MQRKYELDMCRICASLMVVVLHISGSGWYIDPSLFEWKIINIFDMGMRAAVPLFFMISGTLLLSHEFFSIKRFIVRNTVRLIIIYSVWSIIYELNTHFFYQKYTHIFDFWGGVIKGHYHLWFLQTILLAYLFIPIMYNTIHEKKCSQYILFLFLIFVIFKNNLLIFSESKLIKDICNKIDLSAISYFGYMVLGYILSQKNYQRTAKKVLPFLTLFIYLFTTALSSYANLCHSLKKGEATEWLYGYFSFPVFIQACCIFVFFQCFSNIKIKHPKIIIYLSDCTLGIYLLHPLILEFFIQHGFSVSNYNPLIAIPCIFIIILSICFLITGE